MINIGYVEVEVEEDIDGKGNDFKDNSWIDLNCSKIFLLSNILLSLGKDSIHHVKRTTKGNLLQMEIRRCH